MMSLKMRIGSVMPAACTGEITSASIGTASMPMLANPPLARPRRIIAGRAAA
jgi:hypothetical protein